MDDPQYNIESAVGTLAVIGVGLLGGSVAMAAKARGLVQQVIGIGRTRSKLEAAQSAGIIDTFSTEMGALAAADLVVVCTPVDRLADDILAAAEQTPDGAIITDVGSIKEAIVNQVAGTPAVQEYVPAHPLAGSEQTGWQAGSADLFQGKLCVLTPFDGIDQERLQRVDRFWQALGMRTTQVSPSEHDQLLALTSHLPHVVAAALASLVGEDERPFCSTGFRDTTRIAAGDPAVWTPILVANTANVLRAIDQFQAELEELRAAIAESDGSAVTDWLETGRRTRVSVDQVK